jgi:prepilin-type N-terminal cleavage/methylation domain-containing protein
MCKRQALTLIELLAVISIFASIAALVLPAIQLARESARRIACQNNLHELGVALLDYESGNGNLPKGAEGRHDNLLSPVNMYGMSWWVEILPFIGESHISERLDRTGANSGWAYLNTQNGEVADGFGPTSWFCPTSPVAQFVISGDYRIAVPSYSGISGATSHDGFPERRVNRCCRSEGEISAGGALIPNSEVRINEITDGLSHTVMVGEQSDFAYTDGGQAMQIGAGFVKGWLAGTVALGVPPEYADWLAPSYNLTTLRYHLNERRYNLPGIHNDIGANNPLISGHPSIVNILNCDGSVRAMDESAEIVVLKSLATRDDAEVSVR